MKRHAAILPALFLFVTVPGLAQDSGTPPQGAGPYVGRAVGFAESRPVRELGKAVPDPTQPRPAFVERENERLPHSLHSFPGQSADAALQSEAATPNIPAPSLVFEGLSSADNVAAFGGTVMPPDTNGDVGPNYYVQMTNDLVKVWNKAGTPLISPFKLSSLFALVGGPCASRDDGDPIVVYDPMADRWLLSQFCTLANPNYHQMIAVSKTSDPTGQYFVYDFVMPNSKFNDYPHFGVWPDAYYMTVNQFTGDVWGGAGAFAFDRRKLLLGDPTATYIYFDEYFLFPDLGGQLPTDMDGLTPPPIGTPNLFISFLADELGDPMDGLRIFEFRPNFSNPAASTFTQRPDVALAAFDGRQAPASRVSVEQPAPATSADGLDSIADRLMHRIAYRVLSGGVQSYVLNFTVNVSGVTPIDASTYQAGVRWVELRRSGTGAVAVNNQGTYAPGPGNGATGENRWMASVAQDNQGNIALGFSQSSTSTFPTVVYAGRLAGDPAGQLAQGEAVLVAGTGSQVINNGRWGDYSGMTVDPADDCTFWMTNEYRTSANNGNGFFWNTRVGKFKFAGCTAVQKGTIQGTITNCAGGAPLQGAVIALAEGFFRASDASGNYTMGSLPPGTYSVSVSKPGFFTTGATATVTNGGTTVVNACLTPAPLVVKAPSSITFDSCNANGVIDPGETVTVSLCLQNTGTASTGTITGTLQPTGGVTSPSAPQSYGALTAGGGSVCRNFTFVAGGVCGGLIAMTLQLQDGTTILPPVAFNAAEGTPANALSENFDGVTAPALPAGWTASNDVGGGALWVTSTTTPDSSPNAAFVDDPGSTSDKRLTTPAVAIAPGALTPQLTFRNSYNLESQFDGGILEIKVGAGPFLDILQAGGTFASGGYNDSISFNDGSLIAGQQAWTGNSGGYVTTVVNLPAGVAGKTVQFRFRMVSDSVVGATGWRIDGVVLTGAFNCCATPVAQALVVDAHAGPLPTVSNLDNVFSPGETVQVEPAWKNTSGGSLSLTGTGSLFTGPAGPAYTFNDTSANYGTISAGATGSCFGTGNCFQMSVNNPTRPATHWDATFLETLAPGGATKTWTLHIGSSFTDVPPSYLFYPQIEMLLHNKVTSGCTGTKYCPDDPVSRLQMAAFISRALAHGDGAVGVSGFAGLEPYYCASGGLSLFTDVPVTDSFCRHVHYILGAGVTSGCSPGLYCGGSNVTRAQMAIFIAHAVTGSDAAVPLTYGPDPVTGRSYSCDPSTPNVHFTDISTGDFFCKHVDFLWAKDIISGFPDGTYGPSLNVTRGQMSKFLVKGFGLTLYSP